MADIVVQDEDAIRVITMNRPQKKNALTQEMYFQMANALNGAASESRIRAVILSGVPGAFTSGNDLSNFLARGTQVGNGDSHEERSGGTTLLEALIKNRKPLIAAVDGVAVGIGVTMLFHCDYVVASSESEFTTPFVKLGLIPEAASTLLAPAAIGYHRAFELLVMGRRMNADDAYRAGFVNEVVDSGKALEKSLLAAQHIALLPPMAVAITRQLMRSPASESEIRMDLELKHFKERVSSPEAIEAFGRFLNK